MKVKKVLIGTVAALAVVASSMTSAAEWKPDGPLRLQVGFGAGGGTDTLARALAASIEKNTSWDVIVENKPGGGGVAMFSHLVREKPDGRTIGMGVNLPILMNIVLQGDKLPFKAEDFDYLASVMVAPLSMVAKKDAPFDTFAELVAYSKKNDGALVGFDAKPQEMIMRAVNKSSQAGLKLVSHKSGAEVIQSLLGGHVNAGFAAGAHIKYISSGDLKMLAVITKTRHGYSPDTQSLIEQGFDYAVEPYFYLAAPKGLAEEVKARLATVLDDAIQSDEMRDIVNKVMQSETKNLGPDGVRDKLVNGVAEIKVLIDAAK